MDSEEVSITHLIDNRKTNTMYVYINVGKQYVG